MRIAISGSHATGKSTLAQRFASLRSEYKLIEEPYSLMVAEGRLFSDPPDSDDYEDQLHLSAELITDNQLPHVMFERCFVDFLAYLAGFRNRDADRVRHDFNLASEAVRSLDLIVYVPVERPDRIDVSRSEHPVLRRSVDHRLRRYLMDDELGLAPAVLEVQGTPEERANQLLAYTERAGC